jgi:hypothetical protein
MTSVLVLMTHPRITLRSEGQAYDARSLFTPMKLPLGNDTCDPLRTGQPSKCIGKGTAADASALPTSLQFPNRLSRRLSKSVKQSYMEWHTDISKAGVKAVYGRAALHERCVAGKRNVRGM